jgi:hypothetical protein
MGYYSSFTLGTRIPPAPTHAKIMEDLRGQFEEANFALDAAGAAEESSKWYDHEENLKEFSRQYPSVVFVLQGEGEENEDMWIKYFKNGKMQKAEAQITLEDYDENKLT